MGVLSNKMALLIEQLKQSDERLESLTTDYRAWASDYILKTSRQLEEMEQMLED